MTTTFRADLRGAVYTLLAAQQSATPTLLRKVTRYRGGFGELPAAFVGDVSEVIAYDAGLRWREVTVQAIVVDTFPTENIAAADPFDTLMDDLLDRFTAAPQQVANTILELVGIADTELNDSGPNGASVVYRGGVLTFRARIMEGRT